MRIPAPICSAKFVNGFSRKPHRGAQKSDNRNLGLSNIKYFRPCRRTASGNNGSTLPSLASHDGKIFAKVIDYGKKETHKEKTIVSTQKSHSPTESGDPGHSKNAASGARSIARTDARNGAPTPREDRIFHGIPTTGVSLNNGITPARTSLNNGVIPSGASLHNGFTPSGASLHNRVTPARASLHSGFLAERYERNQSQP